jgi:hypothetical protein
MALCYARTCHGLHDPITGKADAMFSWAHASCCSVCSRTGFVCGQGCVLKKALHTRSDLSRHNYRRHLVEARTAGELGLCPDVDYSVEDISAGSIQAVSLHSKALQLFIGNSRLFGMRAAIRMLVTNACYGTSNLSWLVVDSVPLHDTYIVLLVARLVLRIGSVHQALLSSLLGVFVLARPQTAPSALPITGSQIRRVISNISSSTAIVSTVPTPRPVELGLRHAYLYLEDAIGHALAMQPLTSVVLGKYQRLVNSPKGQNCLAKARAAFRLLHSCPVTPMACLITYWFDGWDPNSSLCKANKTPIWSGTATLIFTSLAGKVTYVTTRLIANGPGKADHTEVIHNILNNLVRLQLDYSSHQFWVREHQGFAMVYPTVLLVTCDQPERRTISGLLAGNSKLHACFGVSCDTSLLSRPLEACEECVMALKQYAEQRNYTTPFSSQCVECLNWTLPTQPGSNPQYRYIRCLDVGFPADAESGGFLNTHAGQISMPLLRKAWDEAFLKWVDQGLWTSQHVEAYFKVLTINDATTARFIEQGRKCQLAREYHVNPQSVPTVELRLELERRLIAHASEYQKPKYPPMWALVELDQLPEAVMHLAMGVVKSVSKFIHKWAASRNKSPTLAQRLNFGINMHRQHCRIGRCPMATYSPLGKFPGWVADTFRSWWIWMPWYYSVLDNTVFAYNKYEWPDKQPLQWNGAECKAFLKSRAYTGYSKMLAAESKAVVAAMMQDSGWPPEEVIPAACSVEIDDIRVMVDHCHSLFKHMFAEPQTPDNQHAAATHAKLLLSTITKLDRLMHPSENLPNLYEVKYNFISLTRAVSLLSVYGSARNIQEGGTDGEGIVKMLRPLTPRGLKQHFARNLMNAFHRDQQLQELCEDMHPDVGVGNPACMSSERLQMQRLVDFAEAELDASAAIDDDAEPSLEEEDTMDDDVDAAQTMFEMDSQQFKRYKSFPSVKKMHELGLPLSFVVVLVDSNYLMGFVVGNGATGCLLPFQVGRCVVSAPRMGFAYFEIDVDYTCLGLSLYSRLEDGRGIQHESVVNYGHLLPCLASLDTSEVPSIIPYAVVTTDANHMNASFNFE